jgi:hypothetical protein
VSTDPYTLLCVEHEAKAFVLYSRPAQTRGPIQGQ